MKSDTAREAVARALLRPGYSWDSIADDDRARAFRAADSVISAFTAWLQENGWQIVPKEPDEAMVDCGTTASRDCDHPGGCGEHIADAYRSMLSAAPKLESEEG